MSRRIRLILIVLVPALTTFYGVGEYCRWWDDFSGRTKALEGWSRILDAEEKPQSVTVCQGDEEYDALSKVINRHTQNPQVVARLQEGLKPTCIHRMNFPILEQDLPQDWPKRVFVSEAATVIYMFGGGRFGDKIEFPPTSEIQWVGTMGDIQRWIGQSRDQERFWVSIVLIGILSIVVAFLDAKR